MTRKLLLLSFVIIPILSHSQAERKFSRFLPDHATIQYAGGIGFLSAGFGYESKKLKTSFDFFYGYVPEEVGGVDIHSITGKFTWNPLSRWMNKDTRIDWLKTGLLINYVFGKQYFLFSPEHFP